MQAMILMFREYSQNKKLNVTIFIFFKCVADEEKGDITNCTFSFLGTLGTVLHSLYS